MARSGFGPCDFQSRTGVSRETLDKLQVYAGLLVKWQGSVNLVGKSTLPRLWQRHFYDSAQLYQYLISPGPLIDLGAGAGFPGLVLAAMGRDDVTLIESSRKKCSFLREVAGRLSLNVNIFQERIEALEARPNARYIVSRALAPLDKLLFYSWPLLSEDGTCIFLKGRDVETELTDAEKNWKIQLEIHPSASDAEGIILTIGGLEPRNDEFISK